MSLNRILTRRAAHQRRSFTLAELLISMSILAIFSTAALFAMFGVMEDAKEARTRGQIARLHEMIVFRWDSYQSRAVPVKLAFGDLLPALERGEVDVVLSNMTMTTERNTRVAFAGPAKGRGDRLQWRRCGQTRRSEDDAEDAVDAGR